MLDLNHVLSTPGVDIQTYIGLSNAALIQWQTWRKPRGVNHMYIICVGGGSSGGCGINTGGTSGGGAGGSSGAQSTLLIPAFLVPDILYVQAGQGGQQPATLVSGAVGVIGTPSYVAIEPDTSLLGGTTLIFAAAGPVTGAAATITTGGVAGSAAAAPTISNQMIANLGHYQFLAGQAGAAGGANTAVGGSITIPATGLCVTGGAGGGGANGSNAFAGGGVTGAGLGENFPTLAGGIASVTSTPATSGYSYTAPRLMMYYGGTGGGGASNTAGGNAGSGGPGAPGCGGGGAGGSNSTNVTLARPGNGGPGFVIIISW